LWLVKAPNDARRYASNPVLHKKLKDVYIAAITAEGNTDNKTRETIFEEFEKNKKSIILHYDTVTEGIDLQGVSGVMTLRYLDTIRAIQFIGRAMRVLKSDRELPIANRIKQLGYVMVPVISTKDKISVELVKNVMFAMQEAGIDSEDLRVIIDDLDVRPDGGKKPKSEIEYPDDPELDDFSISVITEYEKQAKHELVELKKKSVNTKIELTGNIDTVIW
jgi:superfamily II DNA/RNA helicase